MQAPERRRAPNMLRVWDTMAPQLRNCCLDRSHSKLWADSLKDTIWLAFLTERERPSISDSEIKKRVRTSV